MSKIIDYLTQPSTYRGIIGVAAGFGLVLAPELQEAIIAAAVGVFGLVEVLRDENK